MYESNDQDIQWNRIVELDLGLHPDQSRPEITDDGPRYAGWRSGNEYARGRRWLHHAQVEPGPLTGP